MQLNATVHDLKEAAKQIKAAADDEIIAGVCDAILAMPRHHTTAVFLYAAKLNDRQRMQAYLAQEAVEQLAEELSADSEYDEGYAVHVFDSWFCGKSAFVQVMIVAALGGALSIAFGLALKGAM